MFNAQETEGANNRANVEENNHDVQPLGYSDGSVDADLPMQQISELFNVNHFVVSQINPHSSLLSSLAVRVTAYSPRVIGLLVDYLRFLKAQFRDWLKNVIDLVIFRTLTPSWGVRRGLVGVITQVSGLK